MPLATLLLQVLVTYGPTAYAAAVAIAHHPDPKKEDFLALLDHVSQEDYQEFHAAHRAMMGLPALVPTAVPAP